MSASPALQSPRLGRPFKRPHPMLAAMVQRGKTTRDVAKLLRCSPESVRSWYKDPKSDYFRPIPKAQAEWLRDHWKIPLTAWHRVQD